MEAAREAVRENRWKTPGGERFWELSGGILRCGACDGSMRTSVTRRSPDRLYLYYACAKHHKERDACPNRRSYRADVLEPAVLRAVCGLLADPGRVRNAFDSRIRREGGVGVETDGEARMWLERLLDVDRRRGAYQEMAAGGLMTFGELATRLDELEAARGTVLRALEASSARRQAVRELERDRDALAGACTEASPEVLERLQPEERHRLYRRLRLSVRVDADWRLTVSGVPGQVTISVEPRDARPG